MTKTELIEKFDAECDKSPNNTVLRVICEHMIDLLHEHDGAAEKIDSKKTLAGAVDAMRKEAKKRASGGVGVLSDVEGFEIVHKYFGIEDISPDVSGWEVYKIKKKIAELENQLAEKEGRTTEKKTTRKVVSLFGTR